MIVINASGVEGGIDYENYLASYYAGLAVGASTYRGGKPDAAFGGMYYVSGPEVSFDYEGTDKVTLLNGKEIAYDFIHYGAEFGHGISGEVNKVTFAETTSETTTANGTENGKLINLDAGLVVSGLDVTAEPGAGNVPENEVYSLYSAVRYGANGEEGQDYIAYLYEVFGSEAQKFIGSDDSDTYTGTAFDDLILGKGGDDILAGGDGADTIRGGEGADTLDGGEGDDFVHGGTGDDELSGGAGDDILSGKNGDDMLFGGEGADRLFGGAGNDTLVGGEGQDVLFGQGGDDVFLFESATDSLFESPDRIADFSDDLIDLQALGLDFIGEDGFSGEGAEVRLNEVERGTVVLADTDGDGVADFRVIVSGAYDLTESDFLL
ncbi:calcium-binding protein [Acuticoccus kandeliae]|uniref:calcium-binding protein n=1 Tax=Acuticoccus kandeliae TaxID=2073160 RepID=UPI000E3E9DED|nr:M10 family metallopeptidase C-terminal domain-containing protein [Acuticoccus kandeliae]